MAADHIREKAPHGVDVLWTSFMLHQAAGKDKTVLQEKVMPVLAHTLSPRGILIDLRSLDLLEADNPHHYAARVIPMRNGQLDIQDAVPVAEIASNQHTITHIDNEAIRNVQEIVR